MHADESAPSALPGAPGERPRVGVSACLLGQRVRYDGRDKRAPAVADTLARWVDFVAVCPEMEVGMGVPRESIELVDMRAPDDASPADAPAIALRGVSSDRDHTATMSAFAARRLDELERLGVAGYVFKARSPSCGLLDVPIFDRAGQRVASGQGLFAAALVARFPDMPVVEDPEVEDAGQRAHFALRVMGYARLAALLARGASASLMVALHSREKLMLLAHHEPSYRRLGPLVARARQIPGQELASAYRSLFMAALAHRPTRGQHVNALEHAAGWLGRRSSQAERAQVRACIAAYRRGEAKLDVALAALRASAARQDNAYVAHQSYLLPGLSELLDAAS